MTQQELINEFRQLAPEDKRALLDAILEIVWDETSPLIPAESVAELQGIG